MRRSWSEVPAAFGGWHRGVPASGGRVGCDSASTEESWPRSSCTIEQDDLPATVRGSCSRNTASPTPIMTLTAVRSEA